MCYSEKQIKHELLIGGRKIKYHRLYFLFRFSAIKLYCCFSFIVIAKTTRLFWQIMVLFLYSWHGLRQFSFRPSENSRGTNFALSDFIIKSSDIISMNYILSLIFFNSSIVNKHEGVEHSLTCFIRSGRSEGIIFREFSTGLTIRKFLSSFEIPPQRLT